MSDDILTLPPPPADHRVAYGSDPNEFADLRMPKKGKPPYPFVLNIHGGFWRAKYSLDHAGHLCAALAAQGIATVNIEYRRVGNPGGAWPGTFADIRSAYRFFQQSAGKYSLDANRLVIMGHSAGGQLALCLAAHEPSVSRVVSLAGVTDLQAAYRLHLSNDAVVEFMHGTPSQIPDHYREADPIRLSIHNAQQLLIHGAVDDVVLPGFSQDYVATKRKRVGVEAEQVGLLIIPGSGHFDLIDPYSKAWNQVEPTVREMLVDAK